MLDNIKPLQMFLWMMSLLVAFLLGVGIKALWELVRDAVVGIFKE